MQKRHVRVWEKVGALVIVTSILGVSSLSGGGPVSGRNIDAMSFPNLPATSDVGDILDEYPAYLKFVLEVGRGVNAPLAQRLEQTYGKLRKRDPEGAARFLRGLRFEMTQKLEMIGVAPESVSTRNPSIRRWVAKFLPAWQRECDEYLFRSFSNPLVRR